MYQICKISYPSNWTVFCTAYLCQFSFQFQVFWKMCSISHWAFKVEAFWWIALLRTFLCLLTIQVATSMKCLLFFYPSCIGWILFLWFTDLSYFHIYRDEACPNMCTLRIFYSSLWLDFHSLYTDFFVILHFLFCF